MHVFERMADLKTREAFLAKKELHADPADEEWVFLRSYIPSEECTEDIRRLQRGDFFLSVPRRFRIKKIASTKRRICYSFPLREKSLLKLMAFVLQDLDSLFSDSLYSFRKSKNHRHFFKKLRRTDFQRRYYVLKMDIHAYGESVDQDILLDLLRPIFADDPDFYRFLTWFLTRNQFYEKGKLHTERVSIIPGTPIGTFFNNVYLMEMDRYVEARSRLYMRFADDIAVFTDTREEAEALSAYIRSFVSEQKLEINEEKTKICEPGESVSLLGIKVSPEEFDIAPESVRKIVFKLKHRRDKILKWKRKYKWTDEKSLTQGIRYVNHYFFGSLDDSSEMNWTAWAFGILNTHKTLQFIDSVAQDMLRSAGSGKLGDARYRITYEDLTKVGYRSLVHDFHHHESPAQGDGRQSLCGLHPSATSSS